MRATGRESGEGEWRGKGRVERGRESGEGQ